MESMIKLTNCPCHKYLLLYINYVVLLYINKLYRLSWYHIPYIYWYNNYLLHSQKSTLLPRVTVYEARRANRKYTVTHGKKVDLLTVEYIILFPTLHF